MKKNLGPLNALYPMLSILVGTEVDGKPKEPLNNRYCRNYTRAKRIHFDEA